MTFSSAQTESAYKDLLETATARISELDSTYEKQDAFRLQRIVALKKRVQQRIDLQKTSGQMLTRIQLENVEQKPQFLTNPAVRRAVRAGNFAPHGSGCSLQATRHSACLVREKDIGDSIGLTENGKTSSIVLGAPVPKKTAKKQPQELVLEHFKQQVEGVQGAQEAHEPAQPASKEPNPSVKDIKNDRIAQEYIAAALLRKLTPDELRQLAEQEKATHLGQTYRLQTSGTHTVSESQGIAFAENFSPDPQSSPKTQTVTLLNYIPLQSAAQLLASQRLAELQDEFKLLREQQTHVSKSRKRVGFAESRRGRYQRDDDSDAGDANNANSATGNNFDACDNFDDFDELDINQSNQFDDLTNFGEEFGAKKKTNELSASSQMIAQFEKLHALE